MLLMLTAKPLQLDSQALEHILIYSSTNHIAPLADCLLNRLVTTYVTKAQLSIMSHGPRRVESTPSVAAAAANDWVS